MLSHAQQRRFYWLLGSKWFNAVPTIPPLFLLSSPSPFSMSHKNRRYREKER